MDSRWGGTVRITKGNRVNIAVVFFVAKFIDDVMLRTFAEPRNRSLNQLLRVRIMTGKQTLSDELLTASFGIVADSGGIHINDDVVKIAEHDRCAILINYAFEKYRQFHFFSFSDDLRYDRDSDIFPDLPVGQVTKASVSVITDKEHRSGNDIAIGIVRAAFHIELTNLVYNLCRYSFLSRKETVTG